MKTTTNFIETTSSTECNINWYEISGHDLGTNWEFDGTEVFGVTDDNQVLNCDGCPLTEGDRQTIAVRNALDI